MTHRFTPRLVLAAGLALFCLSPAAAQQQPAGALPKALAQVDLNNDGKISRAEYLSAAQRRFLGLDLNSDGFVDAAEFAEARKRLRQRSQAQ